MAVSDGVPKEEFLRSIRQALGRDHAPPVPAYPQLEETLPDLESQAAAVRRRLAEDPTALMDKLASLAQLGGWIVYRAQGPEAAVGHIASLASSLGMGSLVRTDQQVFEGLPVDMALEGLGLTVTTVVQGEGQSRELLRNRIIAAGMGLTGADYAVAETGSVVVVPRKGLSRLVSLVPPVHLALVRPADVVETLDDLFLLRRLEYYRQGGDMGSYLNFITGPSRTADIEQTLVVGVHGPKEAHLILLE
jgi:L-lactate dehydrogenase complex protein LldG